MTREILELYGPWFRHPDGRMVDASEMPPITVADQARIDAAWERHKAALNADVVCDHDWREYGTSDLGGDRTEVFCTKCRVSGERDDKTGEVHWPAT